MKHQHLIQQTSDLRRRWTAVLRALPTASRDWATSDGLVWMHLFKTVAAALLALGIAMLLDLQQPRTAMTTVFVLMQPFSGMVLAKSFYRIIGTAAGAIAALVLGAVFVQQPELYMLALSCWIGGCIAAALRYRHFRWYGFVLAGYTAALIGVPTVTDPNNLFLAALTRAAEVAVGIACSSAVSALIAPRSSSVALQRTLRNRYLDFTAFAAQVLGGKVERDVFEERFADLVDGIVGFEATRAFAAFEDPGVRTRSQRLARLNSEFMDVCARLHALNQLLKRLKANGLTPVVDTIAPYFEELSALLVRRNEQNSGASHATRAAVELRIFQVTLPRRVRQARGPLEASVPQLLADFDTSTELLYRFVDEFIRYAETSASIEQHTPVKEWPVVRYVSKTNGLVVGLTFLRSVVVMGIVAWFWIETDWPSGGLAFIGAAIMCALSSTAPDASKMTLQIAIGTVFATVVAYLFTCYVYPNIDGFPLLCVTLAPVLAFGAFIAMRPGISGYGVGFSVFFCLLAGPDNVVSYQPDLLINNGVALVAAMLVASLVLAVIFPAQMPWLIGKIKGSLRSQVVLACKGELGGLNQYFQSSTHDLMAQLRVLLKNRSRQHSDALRWMLVTLEVGHAVIDLRNEAAHATYVEGLHPRWSACLEEMSADIAELFERPERRGLDRVLTSLRETTAIAQGVLDTVPADGERHHDLQRMLGSLRFIRTALLDKDAPFNMR
ncbi:FUSC family protein [Paraburkholderia sp. 1N]|uniref:FUSC family protein n=1 Tax=Paraburkholderia solitsugae TaxID=2675748 RepID=A0ABX2C2N1_9BURK|nr:FUSC family protein [Paraburkholderia solitsugae]NPT46503.1 FUSC family protein [Paraburkholderia solitsugae]